MSVFRLFSVLVLLTFHTSCSTSKNKSTLDYSNDPSICNLNVSFRSSGAGIDRRSYKVFMDYLSIFETEEKVKLNYQQIFWGREGEMDYCFKYDNLNEKQITRLEEQIKEMFIESKSVYYSKETEKRKGR
jgi:hypothetical protein